MLAHVGKRFLHDEDHLNLLSVGEFRLRPRNRELDRQFCLRFESINHRVDGLREAFCVHALSKVQQQLANVLIGLLHTRFDLRNSGVDKLLIVGLQTAFEKLHLQIQERE